MLSQRRDRLMRPEADLADFASPGSLQGPFEISDNWVIFRTQAHDGKVYSVEQLSTDSGYLLHPLLTVGLGLMGHVPHDSNVSCCAAPCGTLL